MFLIIHVCRLPIFKFCTEMFGGWGRGGGGGGGGFWLKRTNMRENKKKIFKDGTSFVTNVAPTT